MKTNKQIYLMMENVGRELYQTINSLDQIVITKEEFDKCFSGVEIPTILNSFPILKKGVFIQKVDNFSDFLIFEVADIKDTGYKLYCKSFQVKNETDFPLWAYNVEAVVSLEDAEEIEVKFSILLMRKLWYIQSRNAIRWQTILSPNILADTL